MSYRLISSNDIAIKYPEVNDMPCIYADLPNGMDGEHYVLEQEPKWIPVSERLPEDAQEVLYSTKTGRVFHGEYYDDNTDRKWFSYKDDIFSFNNVVTAWMPLPKPYEPQESEKDACKNCYYNDGEVHAECVICGKAESEE